MADDNSEPRFVASNAGSADLTFEAEAFEPRPGFKRVHVILGDVDDPKAPHVFWSRNPPGTVWDAQSHHADYIMTYLQGSAKVGDKWYHAGDARIVKAGTISGPSEVGPDGSTGLLVFAHGDYLPIFEEETAAQKNESPYFAHARTPDQ
jgi:hypothetical protein